jgi:hypothetical protein
VRQARGAVTWRFLARLAVLLRRYDNPLLIWTPWSVFGITDSESLFVRYLWSLKSPVTKVTWSALRMERKDVISSLLRKSPLLALQIYRDSGWRKSRTLSLNKIQQHPDPYIPNICSTYPYFCGDTVPKPCKCIVMSAIEFFLSEECISTAFSPLPLICIISTGALPFGKVYARWYTLTALLVP